MVYNTRFPSLTAFISARILLYPSTLSDFTGYNSILADIKAVKDGNVWCTTPDFFQIADTIGSMINDINLMLNADADTSELTYLKKLK